MSEPEVKLEKCKIVRLTICCSSISAYASLIGAEFPVDCLRQRWQSNRLNELSENYWLRQFDQCNIIVQCVLVVASMRDETRWCQRNERPIEIAWTESQIECGVAVHTMGGGEHPFIVEQWAAAHRLQSTAGVCAHRNKPWKLLICGPITIDYTTRWTNTIERWKWCGYRMGWPLQIPFVWYNFCWYSRFSVCVRVCLVGATKTRQLLTVSLWWVEANSIIDITLKTIAIPFDEFILASYE